MKFSRCLLKNNKVIISLIVIGLLLCGCSKKNDTKEGMASSTTYPDITVTPNKEENSNSEKESEEGENNVTDEEKASAEKEISDETDLAAFKEKAASFFEQKPFQGTILIMKNDEIILKQAYGYADIENKRPNEVDTIYEIGSITKQFTAVGIMMLVEDGLISTDDTLDKYLPEYPYASQITIKQLMNMTSGIMDYFKDKDYMQRFFGVEKEEDAFNRRISKEIKNEELLEYVSEYELEFEPGTKYSYSNTNYHFLGMIIEKVSGMSYEEYITENILEPLGMTSTSFNPLDTTAIGYVQNNGIPMPIMSPHPTISYSAGSICSNVDDMLIWENAVIAGELLTEKSWSEIFSGGKYGYGYGWEIQKYMYSHSGQTIGFNSYVNISPEYDFVIIVLANTLQYSSTEVGKNIMQNYEKYLIN
jgi:CubicO group peptidase (beta-lactamase class C family)